MINRTRLWMLMVCVTFASTSLAWGDLRAPLKNRPEPAPPVTRGNFRVTIKEAGPKELEPGVKAKIIIPRSCLPDNQVAAAEQLHDLISAPAGEADQPNIPVSGTILAGVALSLGMISLMFLLRGRSQTRTTAVVVLCGAGILGAWSLAQADIPGPGRRPGGRPPRPIVEAPKDKISIEIVDEGTSVTLILAPRQ